MTVWRYSISWSKFDLALKCPKALQNTIDKKAPDRIKPNYYLKSGILVQKAFEEYFNQGVNLRKGGQSPEVMNKVVDKVLKSSAFNPSEITYPYGKSEEDFTAQVRAQILQGLEIFRSKDLLDRKIRSEVKWNSIFRGFRIFALIDFVIDWGSSISIYDGKGHKEKNADENQLKYYGLALAASDKKIKEAGFIYWSHDFEPVDVSPKELSIFIKDKVEKVRPIFDKLKSGVEDLPTTPSEESCKWCAWNATCEDSLFKIVVEDPEMVDVSFSEVV